MNEGQLKQRPQISAIVVSYNTRDMTLQCLEALSQDLQDIEAEVFVVDNASSDGSAAAIRAEFPSIQLIENAQNVGFGAANNAAMKKAGGDYFLLLNSDAFPRVGATRSLLEFLKTHPQVGAVGPQLLNCDGSLQPSCWRFPSPAQAWIENLGLGALLRGRTRWGDYKHWAHDSERPVDFVAGACLLVRREVWEKVGGFDPSFWMYAEETDWQKRMHEAGFEVYFTPTARVEHWGGASGSADKARINDAFFESLDTYARKHHGNSGLLSLRCAMIWGNLVRLGLWSALWLLRPRRRSQAIVKMRLCRFLVRRQSRLAPHKERTTQLVVPSPPKTSSLP